MVPKRHSEEILTCAHSTTPNVTAPVGSIRWRPRTSLRSCPPALNSTPDGRAFENGNRPDKAARTYSRDRGFGDNGSCRPTIAVTRARRSQRVRKSKRKSGALALLPAGQSRCRLIGTRRLGHRTAATGSDGLWITSSVSEQSRACAQRHKTLLRGRGNYRFVFDNGGGRRRRSSDVAEMA